MRCLTDVCSFCGILNTSGFKCNVLRGHMRGHLAKKHISVGGSSGAGGQVRSEDCLGTKRSPTYARPSEYVLRIHAGCLGIDQSDSL